MHDEDVKMNANQKQKDYIETVIEKEMVDIEETVRLISDEKHYIKLCMKCAVLTVLHKTFDEINRKQEKIPDN